MKTQILYVIAPLFFVGCGNGFDTPNSSSETPGESSSAIVGGNAADVHEYAFVVNLLATYKSGLTSFCGGTLIHRQWVLTAAHCVVESLINVGTTSIEERATNVVVVAGDHRLDVLNEGEQRAQASRVIVHPLYNNATVEGDLALIKLAQPFTLNRAVNTVTLGQVPAPLTILTVVGWGVTAEGNRNPSNVLREVDLHFQPADKCRAVYGSSFIVTSMFCAGEDGGGKGSCSGDSGGPILRKVDGVYKQVGIVSGGSGCALPGAYGLYTKIQNYDTWIYGTMAAN